MERQARARPSRAGSQAVAQTTRLGLRRSLSDTFPGRFEGETEDCFLLVIVMRYLRTIEFNFNGSVLE